MTGQKTRERKKSSKRKEKKESVRKKVRTRKERKEGLIVEEGRERPKQRREKRTEAKVSVPELSLPSRTEEEGRKLISKSGLKGSSERGSVPLPTFRPISRAREERRTKLEESLIVRHAGLEKIPVPSFRTADREREKWTRKISKSAERSQEKTLLEIPQFEIESREKKAHLVERFQAGEGQEAVQLEEVEDEEEEIGERRTTSTLAGGEREGAGVPAGEYAELNFEEFDFLENLLGDECANFVRGGKGCIIIPSGYGLEDMVASICRDIYRERKGGLPTPYQKGKIEDLELEPEHPIEGGVAVIEKASYSEDLIKLLKGFYSISHGYLILVSENPEDLKEKIEEERTAAPLTYFGPSILSKETSSIEKVGTYFKEQSENFDRRMINEYLNYGRAPLELKYQWSELMSRRPIEEGDECEDASEIHSGMKGFLWIYEWRKSGIPPKLEYPINKRSVDVHVKGKNYEVETFYGVGDPLAKLTHKIRDYPSSDIRFVLKPTSILLHLRDLMSFKSHWRKRGKNVEIFGIDVKKKDLVPIEEIVRKMRRELKTEEEKQVSKLALQRFEEKQEQEKV